MSAMSELPCAKMYSTAGIALDILTNCVYADTRFEWDDAKERGNVTKQGIDFATAQRVFEGPVFTRRDSRRDYDEVRHVSVG